MALATIPVGVAIVPWELPSQGTSSPMDTHGNKDNIDILCMMGVKKGLTGLWQKYRSSKHVKNQELNFLRLRLSQQGHWPKNQEAHSCREPGLGHNTAHYG